MSEVVVYPVPKSHSSDEVKFINLTPHPVTFCDGTEIPSHGSVRLSEVGEKVGEVGGVPLLKVGYGAPIVNLNVPESELQGAILIVSGMVDATVAEQLKARYGAKLVVAPYTGVLKEFAPERENGRIKCIKALRVIA